MNPALLTRPLVRFEPGAVAVCCDGNSLTAGQGATSSANRYPATLATLAPLVSASVPVTNIGIGGQTGVQMLSSRADVTSSYAAGKINILVAWELTNSAYFGRTAQQCVTDLLAYVDAVKADLAWRVAVLTAIPRYQKRDGDATFLQSDVDAYNAVLDAANDLLRSQWRGRADLLIDLRASGSGFAFSTYTPATFDATGLYIQEAADGGTIRTHCSDAGYAEVARLVAAGLRRMPIR